MIEKSNKISLFLIGAQKAGTTTLFSWLSQNPEIDSPDSLKDFHFFTLEEYYSKGCEWLESLYNQNNKKKRLHGAVNYIFKEEAAQRIYEYNPDAKLILVLRDPVKRAYSAYKYFKKLEKEKRSFRTAIDDEINGCIKTVQEHDDFTYIEHGRYAKQILQWLQYFKKEQLLILIYEELFAEPDRYLEKIYSFLGLENIHFKAKLDSKNISGEVRYKTINRIVYGKNNIIKLFLNKTKAKHLIPLRWRGALLNTIRDLNTKSTVKSSSISLEDYEYIKTYFEDDISTLEKLLEKEIVPIWSLRETLR